MCTRLQTRPSKQVDDLDLPIKRNQAFMIQYFSKTRDKFCDHLLGEKKRDFRWELLTEVCNRPLRIMLALGKVSASEHKEKCRKNRLGFLDKLYASILEDKL